MQNVVIHTCNKGHVLKRERKDLSKSVQSDP